MENMDSGSQKECRDVVEHCADQYVNYVQPLYECDAVRPGSRVKNIYIKPIMVTNIFTLSGT